MINISKERKKLKYLKEDLELKRRESSLSRDLAEAKKIRGKVGKALSKKIKEEKRQLKSQKEEIKSNRRIKEQKSKITDSRISALQSVPDKIGNYFLKERILSKPKAKLPSYSAVKVVKGLADEARPLVREVEERRFEEPRSLFFKEEFNKERRKVGWI